MTSDKDHALSSWQQRCKTQGLALTASRNAILSALLEQSEARDAVPLLQAAQTYHPATSIGTVYRFLRELEQRGLVDAHLQLHGRTRWQLRQATSSTAVHATGDIHRIVNQVQTFLRPLEQLGLAEHTDVPDAASADPSSDRGRTLAVLHEMAGYLGYRLLPGRRHIA